MNWLDYLFIAILIGSVISGFTRGLARMLVGIFAIVLGILFACRWYTDAGFYVREYMNSAAMANATGFFLVMFGFIILGSLVGALLATAFKWVGLGWMDRLMGAAFGVVRAALVAIVVVMIATAFPQTPFPETVARSRFAPYVISASEVLIMATPQDMQDSFLNNLTALKKTWNEMIEKKKNIAEFSF